jgi:TPR repeat protein
VAAKGRRARDTDAQFNLGVIIAAGRGMDRNDRLAANWYRAAGDQGKVEAQFDLAVFDAKGDGVRQDDVLAADWYRKAAAQGFAAAQEPLGVIHVQGRGAPQDLMQGLVWLKLAAICWAGEDAVRHEALIAGCVAIAGRLSPLQSADAERLVAEWRAGP